MRQAQSKMRPKGTGPLAAGLLAAALLAGCAAPVAEGINDPFERQNRNIHSFNRAVDAALFEGQRADGPLPRYASNLAGNLGLPGKIVNSMLQGRPEPAVKNLFRFAINSTLGVAGIFDPAGNDFALPEVDTDFGETLYVWGFGEGPYVELPLLGPSTARDALGKVVDTALDPVGAAVSGREATAVAGFRVAGRVGDRLRYGETIDSVLHQSADSYAQSRLIYLQNRRHHLGGEETTDADAFDPYEDPYAE